VATEAAWLNGNNLEKERNKEEERNPDGDCDEEGEHREQYDRRSFVWVLRECKENGNKWRVLRHLKFKLSDFCLDPLMTADQSVPEPFHFAALI
jgi:hypothetical protein